MAFIENISLNIKENMLCAKNVSFIIFVTVTSGMPML